MDAPTGYFSKLKAVLFSPREFFESISGDERIMPAYVFMLLSLLLYGAFFGLFFAIIFGTFFGFIAAFLGPALGIVGGGILLLFVFILLLIGLLFFFGSLASFIGAGLLHLFLKLFGGQGSYAKTYQVIAYATGIMLPGIVISLIPFVGALIVVIWQFAIILIGFSFFHQISKLRAFFAWLTLISIPLVIGILIRILFFESTVRTL